MMCAFFKLVRKLVCVHACDLKFRRQRGHLCDCAASFTITNMRTIKPHVQVCLDGCHAVVGKPPRPTEPTRMHPAPPLHTHIYTHGILCWRKEEDWLFTLRS